MISQKSIGITIAFLVDQTHPEALLSIYSSETATVSKSNTFTKLSQPKTRVNFIEQKMITCYLKYVIDPYKIEAFEKYAKMWIPLVNKFGGNHHGYFLPHEGANNIAYALFSFPSLARYEEYREKIKTDDDCVKAFEHAEKTRCIFSFERSFMKPVLQG